MSEFLAILVVLFYMLLFEFPVADSCVIDETATDTVVADVAGADGKYYRCFNSIRQMKEFLYEHCAGLEPSGETWTPAEPSDYKFMYGKIHGGEDRFVITYPTDDVNLKFKGVVELITFVVEIQNLGDGRYGITKPDIVGVTVVSDRDANEIKFIDDTKNKHEGRFYLSMWSYRKRGFLIGKTEVKK